jgi:UDP:flavonoid glycosyltransferase YjiC (YdhE family)
MNPSFALARKLVARGHAIHYLGIADIEERVGAEGFEFTRSSTRRFRRGLSRRRQRAPLPDVRTARMRSEPACARRATPSGAAS